MFVAIAVSAVVSLAASIAFFSLQPLLDRLRERRPLLLATLAPVLLLVAAGLFLGGSLLAKLDVGTARFSINVPLPSLAFDSAPSSQRIPYWLALAVSLAVLVAATAQGVLDRATYHERRSNRTAVIMRPPEWFLAATFGVTAYKVVQLATWTTSVDALLSRDVFTLTIRLGLVGLQALALFVAAPQVRRVLVKNEGQRRAIRLKHSCPN